jgi:uncharacterized protein YdeI (YjbR/CyaY-like superfamily)
MLDTERFEKVEVRSAEELHAWLAANHARTEGVWLVTHRKEADPAAYIPMTAVLDALLCFGWIDGLRRRLDGRRSMQLITPRRHQRWARSYKERAARLEAEGRMEAPGRAAITESKRLGLWDLPEMEAVDDLVVPPDLAEALSAHPAAEARFGAAAPSYRRNVLRWIAIAKRPETRAARIAKTAEFAERGERLPQM